MASEELIQIIVLMAFTKTFCLPFQNTSYILFPQRMFPNSFVENMYPSLHVPQVVNYELSLSDCDISYFVQHEKETDKCTFSRKMSRNILLT